MFVQGQKAHDEVVPVADQGAALETAEETFAAMVDDKPRTVTIADADNILVDSTKVGLEVWLLRPTLGAKSSVEEIQRKETSGRG